MMEHPWKMTYNDEKRASRQAEPRVVGLRAALRGRRAHPLRVRGCRGGAEISDPPKGGCPLKGHGEAHRVERLL